MTLHDDILDMVMHLELQGLCCFRPVICVQLLLEPDMKPPAGKSKEVQLPMKLWLGQVLPIRLLICIDVFSHKPLTN